MAHDVQHPLLLPRTESDRQKPKITEGMISLAQSLIEGHAFFLIGLETENLSRLAQRPNIIGDTTSRTDI